jgi:uncharacterized protein YabE (DUF348 family)
MGHSASDRGRIGISLGWLIRCVRLRLSFPVGRLLILLLPVLLIAGYSVAGTPITLVVNGRAYQRYTHQATVHGLLREAVVDLVQQDLVLPSLEAPLTHGAVVRVEMARPITVQADGRELMLFSRQRRLDGILAEAGVSLKPQDDRWVNGQLREPEWLVPATDAPPADGCGPWPEDCPRPASLRVVVRRSVPVALVDGNVAVTFYTTRQTVGEALLAQGVLVYLGDRVAPGLGSRVVPGLQVHIQRSTPVTLQVDGVTLHTRTQRSTVGEVLAQEGIALMGKDYPTPSYEASIAGGMSIRVVRVQEAVKIEEESIPYETEWVAAPEMPIDGQETVQAGSDGARKRRYRITCEDGKETASVLEDEWLDRTPSTRVIEYGTQIAVRTLDSADGPVEYWRQVRVYSTAYSAATSGKPKDHPRYGITRTGLKAGYGVIAVDPKVIPLGSWVYVPGYGKAIAGDTGASVLGRQIDLGFDDDEPLPLWHRWVDVYLLPPIPAREEIHYVLPNWPQEG